MAKSTGVHPQPRRVIVKRQPNGHAQITVDGHDISGLVMDYQIQAAHREATTLTVTFLDVAVDIDNHHDTTPTDGGC